MYLLQIDLGFCRTPSRFNVSQQLLGVWFRNYLPAVKINVSGGKRKQALSSNTDFVSQSHQVSMFKQHWIPSSVGHCRLWGQERWRSTWDQKPNSWFLSRYNRGKFITWTKVLSNNDIKENAWAFAEQLSSETNNRKGRSSVVNNNLCMHKIQNTRQ